MKANLINQVKGKRTYLLLLERGDKVRDRLLEFAVKNRLTHCDFCSKGNLRLITVSYGDPQRNNYKEIKFPEETTIFLLQGEICLESGRPSLRGSLVGGDSEGAALGGAFLDGEVVDSLEIILTELPDYLKDSSHHSTGNYPPIFRL